MAGVAAHIANCRDSVGQIERKILLIVDMDMHIAKSRCQIHCVPAVHPWSFLRRLVRFAVYNRLDAAVFYEYALPKEDSLSVHWHDIYVKKDEVRMGKRGSYQKR